MCNCLACRRLAAITFEASHRALTFDRAYEATKAAVASDTALTVPTFAQTPSAAPDWAWYGKNASLMHPRTWARYEAELRRQGLIDD
jgi:hypothetical protein